MTDNYRALKFSDRYVGTITHHVINADGGGREAVDSLTRARATAAKLELRKNEEFQSMEKLDPIECLRRCLGG